jgi:hypothetical protein
VPGARGVAGGVLNQLRGLIADRGYVLAAEAFNSPKRLMCPHKPEYDGCKSWLEFDEGFSTEGAVPVIEGRRYADFLEELDGILNPRAFA